MRSVNATTSWTSARYGSASDIRDEKPVVSAYLDGSLREIEALEPDLIVGFSDIQANLAAKLIKAHLPVLIFNQRSVAEIFEMIGTLGRVVDAGDKTDALLAGYRSRIEALRATTSAWTRRPKVYFEEWDEPIISGIQWVSELIEIAGGEDVFPELAREKGAAQRQPTAATSRATLTSLSPHGAGNRSTRTRFGNETASNASQPSSTIASTRWIRPSSYNPDFCSRTASRLCIACSPMVCGTGSS